MLIIEAHPHPTSLERRSDIAHFDGATQATEHVEPREYIDPPKQSLAVRALSSVNRALDIVEHPVMAWRTREPAHTRGHMLGVDNTIRDLGPELPAIKSPIENADNVAATEPELLFDNRDLGLKQGWMMRLRNTITRTSHNTTPSDTPTTPRTEAVADTWYRSRKLQTTAGAVVFGAAGFTVAAFAPWPEITTDEVPPKTTLQSELLYEAPPTTVSSTATVIKPTPYIPTSFDEFAISPEEDLSTFSTPIELLAHREGIAQSEALTKIVNAMNAPENTFLKWNDGGTRTVDTDDHIESLNGDSLPADEVLSLLNL